jgi:hypothetical protein
VQEKSLLPLRHRQKRRWQRKIDGLESLVPKKKKRGQLRTGMNIINQLGQSAYLFQGNFLYLTGGSGLECAV